MANFVKGDWVEVCPHPDYRWEHWSQKNSDLCGKTGKVVDTSEGDWVDEIYVEIEYRGQRVWFKDDQLIKVDNYEVIFSEAVHEACEQLQKHEAICKKLRDEILRGVFGEDLEEPKQELRPTNEIFDDDDWEEVTTKEVIPLPGNGGTMTTPTDPKSQADSHRKKVRKIKNLGKKIVKKDANQKISGSWTLTEEEIQDLQEYLDSLPLSSPPNQAGDYDYQYDYGDDDDSDWFT
tara:strand:- start:133 stop:834 length:702 start_codon:yes stop_codon:yes gene_type:complete